MGRPSWRPPSRDYGRQDFGLGPRQALIALNHFGRLISMLGSPGVISLSLLALIASGGHTELVYMPEHASYQVVGSR